MAFLTAMTITAGAMGVTAYAEEANTAVVTESVQTDGVFSMGAEYHFIKGSDALILDGEGSFTAEEFDEVVKQLSPRTVVLGDNISVPDIEFMKSVLGTSAPYAVYAHENSKAKDDYVNMIDTLEDSLKAEGLDPDEVKIWINYQFNLLSDSADIYKDFTYDQVIIDRGAEMEKYLMENGIEESIAREISSYYLMGLHYRVRNYYDHPEYKEIANPDGTEKNERTAEYIRGLCLRAAEGEQDLLYNENKKGKGTVSKFLAENGINDNENKRITLMYVSGAKQSLASGWGNVQNDKAPDWTPPMPNRTVSEVTEETQAVTEAITEAETQAASVEVPTVKSDRRAAVKYLAETPVATATLIGDVDLNGYVELADYIGIVKNCISDVAFPFVNETAEANADVNEDGKIDVRDAAKMAEFNLGLRGI